LSFDEQNFLRENPGGMVGRGLPNWPIGLRQPEYTGLILLVGMVDGRMVVEPWSELPWAEWDLLLSAGRLEAVDLGKAFDRLTAASEMPVEEGLLGLALAYAAWAQNDKEHLQRFLDLLPNAARLTSDAILLGLALRGQETREVLAPPLLRWGEGLVDRFAPLTTLPGRASPNSIWAVYESAAEEVWEVVRQDYARDYAEESYMAAEDE
jgi:hypothetical protein